MRGTQPAGAVSTGAAQPALSQRATSGFIWMFSQTIVVKSAGLLGTMVLAWLLRPEDFRLVALTHSIALFTAFFQNPGLDTVLIQRNRFHLWGNAAFWMALAFSAASSLVMVAGAPIGAWVYAAPQVVGLVLLLALRNVIDAMGVVPLARLNAEMRFKFLANLNAGVVIATMGLTVLLAWLGLGAYSFFAPLPAVALVRLGLLWWHSPGLRIRMRLGLSRWRFMLSKSMYVMAASVCVSFTLQGDYVVLGAMFPNDKVMLGLYFLAFNLSSQVIQLVALNLSTVLFPSFSQMQDQPERLYGAILRSNRLLACVGVPLAVLQAALAVPAIHVFLPAKYAGVEGFMQIFSLGAALSLLGIPATALLRAHGRFRLYFMVYLVYAVAFIGSVVVGAWAGGFYGACVAEAICTTVSGPVFFYLATRGIGGSWRDVLGVAVPPVLLSVVAFVPLWWGMSHWYLGGKVEAVLAAAVVAVVGGGVYVLLLRVFVPSAWKEAVGLVQRVRNHGRA